MTAKESIQFESEECARSALDMRNTPEDREILHVLSIVLGGIAERINEPDSKKPESFTRGKL